MQRVRFVRGMRATEESRMEGSWMVAWPSFEIVEGSKRGLLDEFSMSILVSQGMNRACKGEIVVGKY
jgi:hypothetical protein